MSLMLLLALAAPAAAGSVDNPQYKEWAQYREGAFVTLKSEVKVNGAVQVVMTQTQKLKQLTAEKAVVEYSGVTEAAGQKIEAPPMALDVPAKLPKFDPKDTPEAKVDPKDQVKYKETKGKETLTIKGQKLDCEWIQIESEGVFTKSWTCKQIPGQIVKTESQAQGAVTIQILTDWKAEKR
jgi:hypothetical protein